MVERDHGCCVASLIDKHETGHCYDKWGEPIHACTTDKLEADYIRLKAHGKRHELAADHVLLCPGHHRGTGPGAGVVWATANRWELREYLEKSNGR